MDTTNTMWLMWWQDADFIVRAVFILLCFLSLSSWSLIIYKWRQLRQILKLEQATALQLTQGTSINELQLSMSVKQPSSALLKEALVTTKSTPQIASEMLAAQLNQAAREIILCLEGGLTLLASIGNAAPFIGLFGTVWGIMHALHALGGDGAVVALDTIAGPVSEALVATAAGIFTAIPAVMGYNLMVRKLRYLGGVIEGNSIRMLNMASQQASSLQTENQNGGCK